MPRSNGPELPTGIELVSAVAAAASGGRSDEAALKAELDRFGAYYHMLTVSKPVNEALAMLDEGIFRLVVPLTMNMQLATKELQHVAGVGVFSEGSTALQPALRRELAALTTIEERLGVVYQRSVSLGAAAADRTVTDLRQIPALGMVGDWYALYRQTVNTLNMKIRDNRPRDAIIRADLASGVGHSSKTAMHLVDVLPDVALQYGVTPTVDVLRRNIEKGRLLPALARQRGLVDFGFTRVASGCERECYDSEESARAGVHGKWFDVYGTFDEFKKSHWNDMWFVAKRFAMYGTTVDEAQIGLNFQLARAIDPYFNKQIAVVQGRHPRIGCPVLSYGGVEWVGKFFVDVCADPLIWDALVERATSPLPENVIPLRSPTLWKDTLYVPEARAELGMVA